MAMEVHDTLRHNMDCLIRKCACLFHDRWSKDYLSFFFCIQLFKQCVNIALQHALASTIKRKIALATNVCSKLICMQTTLEGMWVRDSFLPWKGLAFSCFFGSCGLCVFWPSLFVSPMMVPTINIWLGFFFLCMCTISYGGFLCEEEGNLLHMSTISHIASSFCKVRHLWTRHSWNSGLPLIVVMSSEWTLILWMPCP